MPEKQRIIEEPEVPGKKDAAAGAADQAKTRLHLSHDGFFKVNFHNKYLAESFARENLPAEITKDLDFTSMKRDEDTFVDQKLSHCYVDVLYHILYKKSPAYLYFLFEHKSWEPDFPTLQLLKNMVFIWEKQVQKNKDLEKQEPGEKKGYKKKELKKLPPIIPLLIYHGEPPWKADTNFRALFDIPSVLEKYIPAFSYEKYDVSHLPEEQIIKGVVELRIVLMAFRYIFHPEIISRLKDIFNLFRELPGKTEVEEYLKMLLIYLGSNIKDVKPEHIREAVEKVLEEGGVVMNTVFQQIRDEGKEIWLKEGKEIGVKEGKEIGIEIGVKEGEEKKSLRVALNCLLKGMDIETVAEITDLPIERIKALKAAVQKDNSANH